MRSCAKQALQVVLVACPALSCIPVPVGVGVTVPVGPPPPPPPVVVAGPGFEVNVDRPGYDYRSFALGSAQPEICRNACFSDPACAAFTYVNPGIQGPGPRCSLKSAVPPPIANGCCVSGVKTAAPPPPPPPPPRRALERGIERPGFDYRSFDLPAANPLFCQDACLREPACLSFTYVHPGLQGPAPRCWLKNAVAPPVRNSCCISGVK